MPTRAHVGSGDGVTNPSMTPLRARTATSPRAIVPAVRPSWASDWARVSDPGSIQDQKSRSPTPPATKTAVSSSSPCGRISPQKCPAWSWRVMIEPMIARLAMFWKSSQTTGAPRIPRAMQSAATQALLIHTCAAKCEAAYSL